MESGGETKRAPTSRLRPALAVLAPALCFLALSGISAAPALASTWTVTHIADGPTSAVLYGMSCPSASLCVAVGANSTIASSTNPSGGPLAWHPVHPEGYFEAPPGRGSAEYSGNQIRGVSCPSSTLCVAATVNGHILSSTEPTGTVTSWKIVPLTPENTPRIHMYGISCPSPSLCVAAAYGGKILTSTNPIGDVSAWTVTELEAPFALRGVSCPSTSFCVVVGRDGPILTSTNPTGGASAWTLTRPEGENALYGVSCPTLSLCVAADLGKILISTDPTGGASSWNATAASPPQNTAASCPATSACAVVDNNSDIMTSTDPTGGSGAWSFTNVIPFVSEHRNGTFGVSCPSLSLCAVGGVEDRIITSTDPFAAEPVPVPEIPGHASPRPRARILGHPRLVVKAPQGWARVHFRFNASSPASGFRCKLSGHRRRTFAPCRSPKGYRVTPGHYRFTVFAIGPTGERGPPALAPFVVVRR